MNNVCGKILRRRRFLLLCGVALVRPAVAQTEGMRAAAAPRQLRVLAGPVVSTSQLVGMGEMFAMYWRNFERHAERHWSADGVDWERTNYYDRARVYFLAWLASDNPIYLARAWRHALDYRTRFLEPRRYNTSAHWSMMGGIALHYALTGDAADLRAVGAVADQFAVSYYLDNLGNTRPGTEMDNRQQARVLESFLYAWQLDAPSVGNPAQWIAGGNDWASLLRSSLNAILSSQSADGGYHFQNAPQQGYNKPFMVGLLNDALIKYYEMFDQDPRIIEAVKKSIDYMWANNWDASAKAFVYLEGYLDAENAPIPSPDLNNLIVNGFGWIYSLTGDATYKQRGDQVFAGAVTGAWLQGSKQFNEVYSSSFRYPADRWAKDAGRSSKIRPN